MSKHKIANHVAIDLAPRCPTAMSKHNCPSCGEPINIGQLLGQVTSEAKAKAARANAAKPPREGSRPRGRPPKSLDDSQG